MERLVAANTDFTLTPLKPTRLITVGLVLISVMGVMKSNAFSVRNLKVLFLFLINVYVILLVISSQLIRRAKTQSALNATSSVQLALVLLPMNAPRAIPNMA